MKEIFEVFVVTTHVLIIVHSTNKNVRDFHFKAYQFMIWMYPYLRLNHCSELIHRIGYAWRFSAFKIMDVIFNSNEHEFYREFCLFDTRRYAAICKLS